MFDHGISPSLLPRSEGLRADLMGPSGTRSAKICKGETFSDVLKRVASKEPRRPSGESGVRTA